MPALTDILKEEYQNMFNTCIINSKNAGEVENTITKIVNATDQYKYIEKLTTVPWHVVAVLHSMESGLNFKTHLHNGDPLAARTKHVPAGRPAIGTPPFTFEQSAVDALHLDGVDKNKNWDVAGTLYLIESFNGFGYRKHGIYSPYLWSGSNYYSKGKYTVDGAFSYTAVSSQIGAAVLLRRMVERQLIKFNDDILKEKDYKKLVAFAPNTFNAYAVDLQKYLNTIPGIYLKPDGYAGPKTSEAFKKIFGTYLTGDSRNN